MIGFLKQLQNVMLDYFDSTVIGKRKKITSKQLAVVARASE